MPRLSLLFPSASNTFVVLLAMDSTVGAALKEREREREREENSPNALKFYSTRVKNRLSLSRRSD
jgi:hypothetical protein